MSGKKEAFEWFENIIPKVCSKIQKEQIDDFVKTIRERRHNWCIFSLPNRNGDIPRIQLFGRTSNLIRLDVVIYNLFQVRILFKD